MPRLRCSCQDCGAHAKIAVLMPRLRCSCQDWGAHAEIEVLKSPQSWPEHRNLGMSTSNSAWAPQSKHSNYLCIWGRHHQLDYLTRPRKSSLATKYNELEYWKHIQYSQTDYCCFSPGKRFKSLTLSWCSAQQVTSRQVNRHFSGWIVFQQILQERLTPICRCLYLVLLLVHISQEGPLG